MSGSISARVGTRCRSAIPVLAFMEREIEDRNPGALAAGADVVGQARWGRAARGRAALARRRVDVGEELAGGWRRGSGLVVSMTEPPPIETKPSTFASTACATLEDRSVGSTFTSS